MAQLSSALCASSLENLSAVLGSHSLSEAVLHLSLTLLRLICSFHFIFSFLKLVYVLNNESQVLPLGLALLL